jgi:hypothetical protein
MRIFIYTRIDSMASFFLHEKKGQNVGTKMKKGIFILKKKRERKRFVLYIFVNKWVAAPTIAPTHRLTSRENKIKKTDAHAGFALTH